MDEMKSQIQKKLIASVISDKCAHCENVIFRDAWCTQERVIRFTTPFFRELFHVSENEKGHWNTGDAVMYEAENRTGSFVIHCVFDFSSVHRRFHQKAVLLLKGTGNDAADRNKPLVIQSWDLTPHNHDPNVLFQTFDRFLNSTIRDFEKGLEDAVQHLQNETDDLTEGTLMPVKLNRYERNRKARAACLAAKGTTCAVCGMDFGKVYGPLFAGKIEVHHIVPLNEIGEKYRVDPVNDLVPVCPNCHAALHCKKDGVYTVDELKQMMKENNHSKI